MVNGCVSVSKHGSCWHVASTDIVSSYRAFSREKMAATIGAYIGLDHVNVTFVGKKIKALLTNYIINVANDNN